MLTKTDLLDCVDAYKIAANVPHDRTVSSRLFDDGKVITNLRGRGDMTLGRFNGAMTWFATNWPDGSDLPPVLVAYLPQKGPDCAPSERAA